MVVRDTFKARGTISSHSTLDFLQTMGKVQKCWIGCTFFVVGKDQGAVVVHALPHKTIRTDEARILVTIIIAKML